MSGFCVILDYYEPLIMDSKGAIPYYTVVQFMHWLQRVEWGACLFETLSNFFSAKYPCLHGAMTTYIKSI